MQLLSLQDTLWLSQICKGLLRLCLTLALRHCSLMTQLDVLNIVMNWLDA
jgi:hypothetical protein